MPTVIMWLIFLFTLVILPIRIVMWIADSIKSRAENERMRIKQQAINIQIEKEAKERRIIEVNNKIELEAKLKKEEIKFLEAAGKGIDVCRKCKTISPRRCSCGNCLNTSHCHGTYNSDGECDICNQKRKALICEDAKSRGLDVCDDCGKVNPDRCSNCGCCLEHQWRRWDLCYSCNDAIDGD